MDKVFKISDNMEHTIPFLIIIAKYLISETDKQAQEIKSQLFSEDNRIIEKCITVLKKATRVAAKEDYEDFKGFLKDPSNPKIPGYIYDYQDTYGNKYFNDLPPIYSFEDLERMNDDPQYTMRLTEYKKRLEDRQKGLPVLGADDIEQKVKQKAHDIINISSNNRGDSDLRKYNMRESSQNQKVIQESKSRVDTDVRLRFLLENPPKDSGILSRRYDYNNVNELQKKNQEHFIEKKRKPYDRDPIPLPRFIFPNVINEYEAFFNSNHSLIDEEGQIQQMDSQGNFVERGSCFKPGSFFIKMSYNLKLIFVLSAVILKKACQYFRSEVSKRAIFMETKINGKRTPNSLLYSLLYLSERVTFDQEDLPDSFKDFLMLEGDLGTQIAEVMSNILENPAIVDFATYKMDFTYITLQSLKHLLQGIKQEKLDILWRTLHYFTIIENNHGDTKSQIQYSLFVVDIINQLIFSKAYSHPSYAELIILDVFERYYFGLIPVEIFVSFSNLVSKLAISPTTSQKLQKLIFRLIAKPVQDGSSSALKPQKEVKEKDKKTKDKQSPSTPEKSSTPVKGVTTEDLLKKMSKDQKKEYNLATIIHEAKLDAYLKKLNSNLHFLYSYSGITKQMFNEIKNESSYYKAAEDQFEKHEELVQAIKKGSYEVCFNESDLDNRVNNIITMMEQFKEAILGTQQFIKNDQSGLLLSNNLVEVKDIEGMFLKFAFEDGLKLIVLKSIQQDQIDRRQIQSQLMQLHQTQNRLVDDKTCKICKEMKRLSSDSYQSMIKHYFQKFIRTNFLTSEASLQNQQKEEQEALFFDKNKILELKHVEVFQILLTISVLNGMNDPEQSEEFKEENKESQHPLRIIQELTLSTVCGNNEDLNTVQYVCFSMILHKTLASHILNQKGVDFYVEYFISRNQFQIGHSMFDVLMQSLKNPKNNEFPLNLESSKNPATGHECVIKASKKGKTKVIQNPKKEAPSERFYVIDHMVVHAAHHFILLSIHILNNSRKKYLLTLEKNFVALMEQSMLVISFYSQASKLDQSMWFILKKISKAIITLYFAIYEQFFTVFDQFFTKLPLAQIGEFLDVMKDTKNIKLANQILQIMNTTMSNKVESEGVGKNNKAYQGIFTKLVESAFTFINMDILKDLDKQCQDQLAFNNDKLTGEKLKRFDKAKNSLTLQLKLGFCQLFFQQMVMFFSSEDSEYFYKQVSPDAASVLLESLSKLMTAYLQLLQSSIDIDPVLVNLYQNFTEHCTIFFFFLSPASQIKEVLQGSQALGQLLKSIKQTTPQSTNFLFSFSGLIQKMTENGIPDFNAFLSKNNSVIEVIQYVLEKEEINWEALQFLALAIKQIALSCPKDKLNLMRPLAGPLRQVLSGKYFENTESYVNQDISQSEKQVFMDEVKDTLTLLKPAEVYEIRDANSKIATNRNRIIQGAGLMSLGTLKQLKNYSTTRESVLQHASTIRSGQSEKFPEGMNRSESTVKFNTENILTQGIVPRVDDEFQRILDKYTPQRELDLLAIARNSQKVRFDQPPHTISAKTLRQTQSVAQFYFYADAQFKKDKPFY